jgi:hypothetical protein
MATTDSIDRLSGVWRSSYYKPEDPERVATEHYVNLRVMVLESIPGPSGSYLLGRFTVDDRILTGSYQSQNSPNNSAKDALYYGAAQLVLDEDGRTLRGMGVGFGENMEVKSTIWTLEHVGQQQPAEAQSSEDQPADQPQA